MSQNRLIKKNKLAFHLQEIEIGWYIMSTSTARGGLNIYNALDYICKNGTSFHMCKVYIAVIFVFFNELIQIIHFDPNKKTTW